MPPPTQLHVSSHGPTLLLPLYVACALCLAYRKLRTFKNHKTRSLLFKFLSKTTLIVDTYSVKQISRHMSPQLATEIDIVLLIGLVVARGCHALAQVLPRALRLCHGWIWRLATWDSHPSCRRLGLSDRTLARGSSLPRAASPGHSPRRLWAPHRSAVGRFSCNSGRGDIPGTCCPLPCSSAPASPHHAEGKAAPRVRGCPRRPLLFLLVLAAVAPVSAISSITSASKISISRMNRLLVQSFQRWSCSRM